MARIEVTLVDGLKAGDVPQLDAVLMDLNAEEIITASEESEKCMYAPDGSPVMVHSPARMGTELLCRQIVKIGSIKGPFSRNMLGKLSGVDLAILQDKASELDTVVAEEISKRGRGNSDSEDSG